MSATILITGSTDGIGLETAKALHLAGHRVLIHGRNPAKLEAVASTLAALTDAPPPQRYVADLSSMTQVEALARAVTEDHDRLDVLINNAGVYRSAAPLTPEGLDLRFAVNTFAPYRLTHALLPLLSASSRVVNLSSAAQSPVDLEALAGRAPLSDHAAYAQSKLALTMWSRALARSVGDAGPAIIAVNPGSMLGTKMVKQAFAVQGGDVRVGADILVRAALSDEFAGASGQYFDNDSGRFAPPHPDALDPRKVEALVAAMAAVLAGPGGAQPPMSKG